MLYAVTVINYKGESLRMELAHPEKSGLLIYNIEGIGGAKANINSSEFGSSDGAYFTSARATSRNIVMYLAMYAMEGLSIEDSRHLAYKYFPIKKELTLIFETDTRVCKITGYVESNEPAIFSSEEHTQVSIICPDPFFYAVDPVTYEFSKIDALFEFPFSDESVLLEKPDDPFNDNILSNYDFSNPDNNSYENNDNLLNVYDFRLFPGEISEGEAANGWGYLNDGDGDGTAEHTSQGIKLVGPGERIYEYVRFVYSMPIAGMDTGPYTFSFISTEYGLSSVTGNLYFAGEDRVIANFNVADGINCYIYYAGSENFVKFGIEVYSEHEMTVEVAKVEYGDIQTLVKDTKVTSWHEIGPTIVNWDIVSGLYGNFLASLSNNRFVLRDYISNTEPLILQQIVRIRRNEPMTLSILTSSDLYDTTFTIDDGEYESEWLSLDEGYVARLLCDANSNDARLQICRFTEPEIVSSAVVQLRIMKLEYSEFQTLAVKVNGEWVLKEKPKPIEAQPTLEFGTFREGHATIVYRGDTSIGMTITIHSTGDAENITIYSPETSESITINTKRIEQITGKKYSRGDDIIINTASGRKSVKLLRNGFYTNIIGAMDRDADWFVLTTGENIYDIFADSGVNNLIVTFSYNEAYMGV